MIDLRKAIQRLTVYPVYDQYGYPTVRHWSNPPTLDPESGVSSAEQYIELIFDPVLGQTVLVSATPESLRNGSRPGSLTTTAIRIRHIN